MHFIDLIWLYLNVHNFDVLRVFNSFYPNLRWRKFLWKAFSLLLFFNNLLPIKTFSCRVEIFMTLFNLRLIVFSSLSRVQVLCRDISILNVSKWKNKFKALLFSMNQTEKCLQKMKAYQLTIGEIRQAALLTRLILSKFNDIQNDGLKNIEFNCF